MKSTFLFAIFISIFTILITFFLIGVSFIVNSSNTIKSNEKIISTPEQQTEDLYDEVVYTYKKAVNTGKNVTTTPEQTVNSNENVASTPEQTANSNKNVTTTPEQTVNSNENVASTPEQTANSNENVASTPEQTANSNENVTTTPEQTANSNKNVTSAPEQTTNPDNVREPSNSDAKVADTPRAVCTLSVYYTKDWAYGGYQVWKIIEESSPAYPAKLVYPGNVGLSKMCQGPGAIPGLVRYLDRTAPNSAKKIIYIADHGEICYDTDCKDTKKLLAKRKDIIIDVIFVGGRNKRNKNLNCLTGPTGGTLYTIDDDINEFKRVLRKSMSTTKKNVNSKNYKIPNETLQESMSTKSKIPNETTLQNYRYYQPYPLPH